MKSMAHSVGQIVKAPPNKIDHSDPDEQGADLQKILSVVSRRRYLIAAVGFAIALITGVVSLQLPNRYEASAIVMLNTRTMTVVDFESVLSGLAIGPETIESEISLIRSAAILGQVIDEFDLVEDPEFNTDLRDPSPVAAFVVDMRARLDALVRPLLAPFLGEITLPAPGSGAEATRYLVLTSLREALTVEQVNLSVSIAIRVMSESPQKAARLANAIAEIYLRDQMTTKAAATENATEWLSERVAKQRVELERLETELSRLLAASSGSDAQALSEKAERLKDLEDRLLRETALVADLEANAGALRRLQDSGDYASAASGETLPPALRTQLSAAATGRDKAALITREIDRLDVAIARSRENVETLQRGAAKLRDEISTASDAQVRIQQLTSAVEATRLVYEALIARLNETASQFGMLQADGRIVSPAFVPEDPAAPRRTIMVLVAGAAGLALGLALAFLLESLNTRVRSARAFEDAIGLPVLAHMPLLRPPHSGQRLIDVLARTPMVQESAQSLSTALALRELAAPPKVIMVTSSHPHEGKSTICLMLAQADAILGKSVAIVDADFRRPTMLKSLAPGSNSGGDLIALLDGRVSLEQATQKDKATGVAFLGERRSVPYATRVIASEPFRNLIEKLREIYDTVLIDAPPVLLVSDAFRLGMLADTSIFAVRWNMTSTQTARLGVEKLQQHGVSVSGAVMTFVDFKRAAQYDQTQYSGIAYDNPYF